MSEALISRTSKSGQVEIKQKLGTSITSVLSQNASTELLAEKSHTHTVNDLKNIYFYAMDIFDASGFTYAQLRNIKYTNGYYLGTVTTNISVYFIYSTDGFDFKRIKISDNESVGILVPVFTVADIMSDNTIVLFYGSKKYTLSLMNLNSNPQFTETLITTLPSGARSPKDLQYIPNDFMSGTYYLNESYGYASNLLGGIWSSSDGLIWNKKVNSACSQLFIDGTTSFLLQPASSAPAPSFARGIYMSNDFTNYTSVWTPESFGDNQGPQEFQYINGLYVFNTYYNIYTSSDGMNWTKLALTGQGSGSKNCLTWDNSNNVWYWYNSGTGISNIYKSSDLSNWELLYEYKNEGAKSAIAIIPVQSRITVFAQSFSDGWDILVSNNTSEFLLPLKNGGTGASTISTARANLDVYSKSEVYNISQTYTKTEIDNKFPIVEEGTWTPSIRSKGGTDPTYTVLYRYARYKRVGNMCYVSFHGKWNITAAGTDYACVIGLPFTASNNMNGQSLAIHEMFGGINRDPTRTGTIPDNISQIYLAGSHGSYACQWQTGETWVGFSGWYLIAE